MKLRDLLAYDDIVIQCHDNPDADSIACGFAVYRYLTSMGKHPSLVYGGISYIRKSNLVMLVQDLEIPIEHVDRLEAPELLVTVDCQYMGGNVAPFPAKQVAVIDHHRISTKLPKMSEVRSNLGSCATIMWQLLKEEGYDVGSDRKLATALYYGLFTDTNSFTEIVHPLDKDLRDEADFDQELMVKYRNANLSLEELEVAGAALLHSDYIDAYRAALVKSGPCDPNILGIISDLVLEVDAIDVCIVFNIMQDGVKLSVRSCTKEVKANELVAELCQGIGSGGGHLFKAGGFIQMDLLVEEYLRFCEKQNYKPRMEFGPKGKREQPTASGIKAMLEQRLKDYMDDTDLVNAQQFRLEEDAAELYCRRPIPWGFVKAGDLFAAGTQIRVRAINGDSEIIVEEDTIFTLGPKGEMYASSEEEFAAQYRYYQDWKYDLRSPEYKPTIQVRSTGKVVSPMKYARVCVPKGGNAVYARQLDRKMKLFGMDEEEPYLLGRVGDYIVSRTGEPGDVYIIGRDRFERTHMKMGQPMEKKAVIFDLDGTLLDTLEDLKEATNAALASKGLPQCTLEQVRAYVGNGVRMLMKRAVPDGEDNPAFEEVFAFFKEYYAKHCLDHTAPYHNILHLIAELRAQHVSAAIVSNKIDFAVKELAERFFAEEITVAIGEMEHVARKPAPDMVEKALAELGVPKERAIYVGDSDVDIETAANSGLPCVSVTWGFREKSFLKEKGASTLIERPLELLYLL